MTPLKYLVLGYAMIWAALAVYLFTLGRRMKRMRNELEELRRRVQGGGTGP
jgi:CcmD family protein